MTAPIYANLLSGTAVQKVSNQAIILLNQSYA
jgi:hypothetical protein